MAFSATQLFNNKVSRALGKATFYTLMATNLVAGVITVQSDFGSKKAPTAAFRALDKCLSVKSLHRDPIFWTAAVAATGAGVYAGHGLIEFSKIYGQTIRTMGPLPLNQQPH